MTTVESNDWLVLESELLAKLSFTIDATILNKMILKMKNAGDDGLKLGLKIKKGSLENIEGYYFLIKKASIDNQGIKAVNQALDKAEKLIANGKKKSMLRFEDDTGRYDVDLGVKSDEMNYSEVYQFKTNTETLSKKSIKGASKQLYDAPSNKRIVEFKLSDNDDIFNIKNNEVIKAELIFQLYEKGLKTTNNIIINEFHLLSSTGEKVKVVYENNVLQFVNF